MFFRNFTRTARRQQLRLALESLENRRLLAAGPYAPAAGQEGSTAIDRESPAIVGWATGVSDYSPGAEVSDTWQDSSQALGPAEGLSGSIVSLGRNGTLTLTFDEPIRDGLGFDFAVFENSFSDTFLELGFVEVSSDGTNFVRFESDSRTDAAVGAFGSLDATNLNNLAGKYRGGFGTPFDLEELRGSAGLDVTAITHVRLVDIFGDGTVTDGQGDPIYDPTPTIGSAGLDVDGVAVLHAKETGLATVGFETIGAQLSGDFSNRNDNGFAEDELLLNNDFDSQYGSWQAFAISKATDNTTAGFMNQYSAFTGEGHQASDTYAVGFYSEYAEASDRPTIQLDPSVGSSFDSLWITNTTYAALSMQQGDSFAKQFGGPTGNDPDFFEVDIHGLDANGQNIGTVTTVLADYRFENAEDDFIVDEWIQVDLSSLVGAQSIQFQVRSSDVGDYGINTPTYFAIDDVTVKRPQVSLDLASAATPESEAVQARVSRPSLDNTSPFTVSISNSDPSLVSGPTTITLPAGSDYSEFLFTPADDDLVGPDTSVDFTATAELQAPRIRTLSVLDDDVLALAYTIESLQQTEGQSAATVTLRRNAADVSSELSVTLQSSESTRLGFPTNVTFAAGQRETSFQVNLTDDDRFSFDQSLQLTASANGHENAVLDVEIVDNDVRELSVTEPTTPLSEGNPGQTVSVTVARNDFNLDSPLTVNLTNPATGLLDLPSTVTIPEGAASATFQVGVIDNSLLNNASVFTVIASHSSATDAEFSVEVIDDEQPTFALKLLDGDDNELSSVTEGTEVRVQITRQTNDVSDELEVTLSQSLNDRVSGPASITIPANTGSAEVTWLIQHDTSLTGEQAWSIQASAVGFETQTLQSLILDLESPSLSLTGPASDLSESDAELIGDFEVLGRGVLAGSYVNNAGPSGAFQQGNLSFGNSFSNAFGFDSWSGFAISRATDTTTPGYFNQYSAVTGHGARDSDTYGVGFNGSDAVIRRDQGSQPFESIAITNTTYAALSMLQGDAFAKQFGGATGDDPDTFILTIEGKSATGESIGTVDFYLADYRFEDNSLDYVIDEWTTVDLTAIGEATELHFQLSSTDVGQYGMNTPGYFAIDDVKLAPAENTLPNFSLQRNTLDNSQALEVALSTDSSDVELPAMVIIPAGQDTITVPIRVFDNLHVDGDRQITVTAAAEGFSDQALQLTLQDDDTSTLTVTYEGQSPLHESTPITIDVEDIGSSLEDESFQNGSDESGFISTGPLELPNSYNSEYGSWSGWSASNMTDVTTEGYGNQYSAFSNLDADVPGGGDGSDTYLVGTGSGSSAPTVSMPAELASGRFASLSITNTTYAALSMQNGDAFAKKFGGESGDDADYFLLTIVGVDSSGAEVGEIDFYLADYRFEDNSLDYIVDEWTTIDLTSLEGSSELRFELSSSDVGQYGMNTPAYFALDNLLIDQVPGASGSVIIHRNDADLSQALPIEFVTDDSRFEPIPGLKIPAGYDSIRVPISILNDRMVNSSDSATWTFLAEGYTSGQTVVSIVDDEVSGIELVAVGDASSVQEGSTETLFSVRLTEQPAGDVVVGVQAILDGIDASEQVELGIDRLSFTTENWDQPQSISVSGIKDQQIEPTQTVLLKVSIQPEESDSGYATANEQSASFELLDYQPTELHLAIVDERLVVRDELDQAIWASTLVSESLHLTMTDQEETLTVDSLNQTSGLVTIAMAGGDDQILLNTTWFTSINGGDGFDRMIIQPADHGEGEETPIDLAAWLQNRVVNIEEFVLGGADLSEPLHYELDSVRLNALFGANAPIITSIGSQNLQLTGTWQLGVPIVSDGLVRQRLVSDQVEVQVITSTPWRNAIRGEDVNANGEVTALDALMVINRLNADGSPDLAIPNDPNELIGKFYDVSGDGKVSALDALKVINYLNQHSNAEFSAGEPLGTSSSLPPQSSFDLASQTLTGRPASFIDSIDKDQKFANGTDDGAIKDAPNTPFFVAAVDQVMAESTRTEKIDSASDSELESSIRLLSEAT
ncbi:DUF4465 domain-containing protein [Rhodopirellula sp. JC740]|uniref:DUF4465 domain-containing protein n=1 Tax=Rhodopirellula halodulae TaxID=2894198 RepID=A0ABS8NDF3_9BACT|nr:DUF4465 domain-containing protein [Rhodopirellula sp. JC740]